MRDQQNSFRHVFLSLDGRINRARFWLYQILIVDMLYFVICIIGGAVDGEAGVENASMLATLILIWPTIALNVKRLHDRNRSGIYFLAALIPIVNIWYMIEVLFMPGEGISNQYGPDPLLPRNMSLSKTEITQYEEKPVDMA